MNCPVFPKPNKHKASWLKIFFKQQRSWLDTLYYRSYKMKMGQVKLPNIDLFVINQPELVKRVMIEETANFPKHRLLGEALEPLLGESIFTTNGTKWRKQRNMLNPSFGLTKVQHVFSLMQAAVDEMMSRIAQKISTSLDVDAEMTYVTADIIFRTILSTPLKPEKAKVIIDAFNNFQADSPKVVLMKIFKFPRWLQKLLVENRRIKAGAKIRSAIEEIVLPRYEAKHQAFVNGSDSKEDKLDILSSLLGSIDKETGEPFSFTEIIDQITMLFLAGHETSASALTWSLYLLATHPKIQDETYAEINRVSNGDILTIEKLKELQLVRNVFREALRLYPPVSFFARECTADTTMRNKKVSLGSLIIISPWLIQRHQDFWDKPNEFNPYRFFEDKPKVPLRDSYLPFGKGERVCIGAAFAEQEAVLILSTLLQKYHFEMAPGFIPEPVSRVTVRSKNGMQLILQPRETKGP